MSEDLMKKIPERDFIEFKNRVRARVAKLTIKSFNDTQDFVFDHIPRDGININVVTAAWRAVVLDSIATMIRVGNKCEMDWAEFNLIVNDRKGREKN